MNKRQIWVLFDGKPGHLSQSLGLAERLASIWDADVHAIEAHPQLGVLRSLALWFCPFTLLAGAVLRSYKVILPPGKPDLIVSFGGKVVPLNVALAHQFRCPNVLIGNRYGLSPSLFTVLVNARDEFLPNQVVTKVPFSRRLDCQLSPAEASQLGQLKASDKPLWGMLIGGDGSGYHFAEADWQQLVAGLIALAERHQIRWLLSTSRRTPVSVETMLDTPALRSVCEDLILFHRQPAGIKPMMLAAERLFVTEDSLSMITEAVSCDVPVVLVRPRAGGAESEGVHSLMLQQYMQIGLVERCAIGQLPDTVWGAGQRLPVRSGDLLRQAADQVLVHL